MDFTTMLELAGLSTSGVAMILVGYRIWKSILGKKLISNCCGKRFEVGMDIGTMTPTDKQNPLYLGKSAKSGASKEAVAESPQISVVA